MYIADYNVAALNYTYTHTYCTLQYSLRHRQLLLSDRLASTGKPIAMAAAAVAVTVATPPNLITYHRTGTTPLVWYWIG